MTFSAEPNGKYNPSPSKAKKLFSKIYLPLENKGLLLTPLQLSEPCTGVEQRMGETDISASSFRLCNGAISQLEGKTR